MSVTLRAITLFTISLLATFYSFGQDAPSKYEWKGSGKKVADKSYEITLTTTGLKGWQLYAPEQSFDEFNTGQLVFGDSTIGQTRLEGSGVSKIIRSPDFDSVEVKIYEGATTWKLTIHFSTIVPAKLQGVLNYSYARKDEFLTASYKFEVSLEGGIASTERIKIDSIDLSHPVNPCGDDDTEGKSLWTIFILGLIGGFIALLTPCVFPLIPLTVSFFTKKDINRKKGITNAAIYGFFIFLIYVLLSLPFHIFLNKPDPEVLNKISTNIWLNIGFFAVFVVFAISFFGYFEITLPGGLANKINKIGRASCRERVWRYV